MSAVFPIAVTSMHALCLVYIESDKGRLNSKMVFGDHCRILLSGDLFPILDQHGIEFRKKDQDT